jgi:hypothetical protein
MPTTSKSPRKLRTTVADRPCNYLEKPAIRQVFFAGIEGAAVYMPYLVGLKIIEKK